MDLSLKEKAVVVTGASQGLGRASAMAFAEEGAHVWISSRSEEKLQTACNDIRKATGNEHVKYVVCDMRQAADIQALVKQVATAEGTVDVLVNNAGGPPAGGFLDMDDETWQGAFEQNLLSVVRTSREVIPYMQKNSDGGRIVNLTSSSIRQTIDNLLLSNTMRPGVFGLTKSLAEEFAKDNILVNTVGPGKIATARINQLHETKAEQSGKSLEEIHEAELSSIPMGRLGEPEEFAKAVLFLGSFTNTYMTGQGLIVDGAAIRAL